MNILQGVFLRNFNGLILQSFSYGRVKKNALGITEIFLVFCLNGSQFFYKNAYIKSASFIKRVQYRTV